MFHILMPTISAIRNVEERKEFASSCGFKYSTHQIHGADKSVTIKTNAYGVGYNPERKLVLDELQKCEFVQIALLEMCVKTNIPVTICGANIADFKLIYLRINRTVQNIHFEGNTFKRMMIELNAGPSNIKGFVGEVLNYSRTNLQKGGRIALALPSKKCISKAAMNFKEAKLDLYTISCLFGRVCSILVFGLSF